MYFSPLLVATENTNAATENEINRGTRGYQKFPVLFSLGLQLGGEEMVFLLNKSCRKRKLDIRPTRFDFGTLCSGLCSEARAEKKSEASSVENWKFGIRKTKLDVEKVGKRGISTLDSV